MKRLVVCCDGTWNTAEQKYPTNVSRFKGSVQPRGSDGLEQRAYYVRGVGTAWYDRFSGGAFGTGLSDHVKEAYRLLVTNFEPGDELFLLGFSRGAYTARSLAGLVRNCGILSPENSDKLDEAYELYRDRTDATSPTSDRAGKFRAQYSQETGIYFVGVWDTVGSLGIPLGGLRWVNVFNRRWQFHDVDLSTTVDRAFQALAVDELRQPFKPAVWNVQPAPNRTVPQDVDQVWFAGVHCDVGGGLADHGLSDITYLWMAEKAQACGLAMTAPAHDAVDIDPLKIISDSRTTIFRLLPAYHRPIGPVDRCAEDKDKQCAADELAPGATQEYVSTTTLRRLHAGIGYSPTNLTRYVDGPGKGREMKVPETS
jgi:uncharacterized protein (DUF2235 family)